jgi:DNA-binding response OmpR family regulator
MRVNSERSGKILLADDEPSVQRVLARRLQAEGYQVVTAADGDEALQKANLERPDVILLDIMLPKKNGNVVAAELREQRDTARIPIIFITCLVNNNEARVMRYQAGGNRIMGKPIDSRDLIELIEEVRVH